MLRIDEKYDGEDAGSELNADDPWRPMNVYVHSPGAIGQTMKATWYKYDESGQNPATACDSGEYYYFYDALGNVEGVLEDTGNYYRWPIDAFGNPDTSEPSANNFLAMDQPGPKEHLTGKMFDTTTGLYYFHARWYDPEVGRFVSKDRVRNIMFSPYLLAYGSPINSVDPSGMLPWPPKGKNPVCNLRERIIEWDKIKQAAIEGNRLNNTKLEVSCGERAGNIIAKISKLNLCCYKAARMTRHKIVRPVCHTITVIRIKTNPTIDWEDIDNPVIDDYQWPDTPRTGKGVIEYYDMRTFRNRYPFLWYVDPAP